MQGPKRINETDGAELFLELDTLGWNIDDYRYTQVTPYGMAAGVTATITGYPEDDSSSVGDSVGSVGDTYVPPVGNDESPDGNVIIKHDGLTNSKPFLIDCCRQGLFESLRVEFSAGGSAYVIIKSWGPNPHQDLFR